MKLLSHIASCFPRSASRAHLLCRRRLSRAQLAPPPLRPVPSGPRRLLARAPPAARSRVWLAPGLRACLARPSSASSSSRPAPRCSPRSPPPPSSSPRAPPPPSFHELCTSSAPPLPSPPLPLSRFPLPFPCPSFCHQQGQRKREGIAGMPEVEAARRAREAHCLGRRIARCAVAGDPKVVVPGSGATHMSFERAMVGRTIVAAHRRGKNRWIRLDAPRKVRPSPMAEGSSRSCPVGGSLALDDSEVVEVSAEVAAGWSSRRQKWKRSQVMPKPQRDAWLHHSFLRMWRYWD